MNYALSYGTHSYAAAMQELVTKKMQLALSEEAMLNMVDKYEKRINGKAQSKLSSLWRAGPRAAQQQK